MLVHHLLVSRRQPKRLADVRKCVVKQEPAAVPLTNLGEVSRSVMSRLLLRETHQNSPYFRSFGNHGKLYLNVTYPDQCL